MSGKLNSTNISSNQGSTSLFKKRQSRLEDLMKKQGIEALVVNSGPTLTYLTGLHFHLSERPVVIFFSPQTLPAIVLPEFEAGKTDDLPYPLQVFPYREDPDTWQAAFSHAAKAVQLVNHRVGVEPTRLRFLEMSFLQAAAPNVQFISAEETLADLRMRKDREETETMHKAVDIAQRALSAVLPLIKIGMSEQELASELTSQVLRAGSDPLLPFSPIVSAGPNGANPHATPTHRPLQSGDLLVIDWGASFEGYFSDLTRTFAVGEVDSEMQRLVDAVHMANRAGREAVRPGIACETVDHAAREIIEKAGYGDFFIHRTGHGLGMESHEPPYIRSGNPMKLEPGMTFTIEPGIYLAGRNGCRIEDDVIVTETGYESLSDFPRELTEVG